MTSGIWKKANWLLKNNKVKFAGSGTKKTFYDVNDPEDSNHYLLQIETNSITTISCTCKAGSIHLDGLCSHKLAVIQHNLERLKAKPIKGILAKQI